MKRPARKPAKVTSRQAREAWKEFGLSFGFAEASALLDEFLPAGDDPRLRKLTPAQRAAFAQKINSLGRRLAEEQGRGLRDYQSYLEKAPC